MIRRKVVTEPLSVVTVSLLRLSCLTSATKLLQPGSDYTYRVHLNYNSANPNPTDPDKGSGFDRFR